MTVASLSYTAVLIPVTFWGGLSGTSPWRFAIGLLPVIPAAWMFAIIISRFRELDEYQLRIAFPGVGAALAAAMLTSVTVGFVSLAGAAIPGTAWIIFAVGMITWWIVNQVTGAARQF